MLVAPVLHMERVLCNTRSLSDLAPGYRESIKLAPRCRGTLGTGYCVFLVQRMRHDGELHGLVVCLAWPSVVPHASLRADALLRPLLCFLQLSALEAWPAPRPCAL